MIKPNIQLSCTKLRFNKRFHDHWLPLSDEDEEGIWRHYETGEVKKEQKHFWTHYETEELRFYVDSFTLVITMWAMPSSETGALVAEYLDINYRNKVAAFTDWGPGQPNGRAVQNCACLRKFNGYRWDFTQWHPS